MNECVIMVMKGELALVAHDTGFETLAEVGYATPRTSVLHTILILHDTAEKITKIRHCSTVGKVNTQAQPA